jgi:hypothetical protein
VAKLEITDVEQIVNPKAFDAGEIRSRREVTYMMCSAYFNFLSNVTKK